MRLLQPAADAIVRWGAPRRVDPLWLVTVHGLMGLAAAVAIGASAPSEGGTAPAVWWLAAALLLVKAILDNADGGLARATGRVTRMGRYYDSGVDVIVNAAVFVALGRHVGVAPALAGWAASTLVLSLDFNMERLYRAQRASPAARAEAPMGAPEPLYRAFEGLYRVFLAPQDRWIERLDRALFRYAEGTPYERAPEAHRRAWSDLFSTAALVDLGLSTQTLALAVALIAGRPGWFVAALVLALPWALGVQLRRIARYRAYRRRNEEPAA